MRVGNVFGHVCVSVCVSVCLSVQAITFEPLHIEISFLACRYILTISRSSWSIKVIGSRSRYMRKMIVQLVNTCLWLQVIDEVKVTHQGEGHIKVKVKISSSLPTLCKNFTYFNILVLCMWLRVINKVKVTHLAEGHIKVKVKYLHPFKVKYLHPFKFYVAHTFCKRMVCIRLKCYLFLKFFGGHLSFLWGHRFPEFSDFPFHFYSVNLSPGHTGCLNQHQRQCWY